MNSLLKDTPTLPLTRRSWNIQGILKKTRHLSTTTRMMGYQMRAVYARTPQIWFLSIGMEKMTQRLVDSLEVPRKESGC
jgi:hypothetical protein